MMEFKNFDNSSFVKSENSQDTIFEGASDPERPFFELQFNIYYTKYDFVPINILTYIAPKCEEDIQSFNSPRTQNYRDQINKPIFIGKLTSGFLLERAK